MSSQDQTVDKEEAMEGSTAQGAEPAPAEAVSCEEKARAQEDAYLRAMAEMENQRKRCERQLDEARKYAVERFARELLPVLDGLEMALASPAQGEEGMAQLRQGVEMTLQLFAQAMAKFGISPVYPLEERFDPGKHQAIASVEHPGEANKVLAVHQKGYLINERLLRPALVSVSKAGGKEQ